ncbi:hypothetical protein QTP86_017713 [Hemibagrus guttatus]|nr:hypothetical protein QTP86_017713 [Hemibagrus guttatus]
MSKALANRLRDIMDSVIQTDQTYCVHNRSIIDNVSLIRDISDVSMSSAVDLGLISLDQEKAFDRVEHQYLWKTLEAFGLSPSLIAMMKKSLWWEEDVWTLRTVLQVSHTSHTQKVHNTQEASGHAGREFKDTRAVAEELGLRSLRYTEDIIQRWTNKRSEDELNLIKEYHDGTETPDRGDPFPELELLPDLHGHEGVYLDAEKGHVLPIYEAKGKTFTMLC